MRVILLSFCLVFLLAGCKQTYNAPITTNAYLHDHLFPGYEAELIETEEEIFAISYEMKKFVNRKVRTSDSRPQQD